MAQFNKDLIDDFLGAVRKYMHIRGPMTQRELAEATDTGVSTMSRFLNQQTQELNPNLIANITAKLKIPLHEIIDFVDEEYVDEFERLVRFYKGEDLTSVTNTKKTATSTARQQSTPEASGEGEAIYEALKESGVDQGGSQAQTQASIRVGGRTSKLVYEKEAKDSDDDVLKQKVRNLSLKQQGFLNEFLNLDSDGRDLVADVGRNIISYLKQKGIDF